MEYKNISKEIMQAEYAKLIIKACGEKISKEELKFFSEMLNDSFGYDEFDSVTVECVDATKFRDAITLKGDYVSHETNCRCYTSGWEETLFNSSDNITDGEDKQFYFDGNTQYNKEYITECNFNTEEKAWIVVQNEDYDNDEKTYRLVIYFPENMEIEVDEDIKAIMGILKNS